MIVAFYATLIGVGGPDWGETGKAFVSFQIPAGGLATALAFISTNAAVTTGIYSTYLGKEKKWKKEDLFNGVMLTDAVIHIISVVLITGSIILVGAIYCILQDRKLQRLLNWRKCWFRSWEMQRSILWEWRC